MREFDTLRASIPPLAVVPGSVTANGGQVGDSAVGTDYVLNQSGWVAELEDPGPLASSARTTSNLYALKAYYRNKIEWTPWAREDLALVPLGQDIAEGTNFRAFHTPSVDETIGTAVFPGWSGADAKVLDIWSSEEIEEKMLENIAWNGWIPGSMPKFPLDVYSALNMPQNNPDNIAHKLRFDQIISARYRQMVSADTGPTAQYIGGEMMTIHDSTIGGNASLSDYIHHARYVYILASNKNDNPATRNNLANPAGAGTATYNYAKVGFFVPSAMDTLTIGIEKIENDAEWSTIIRRGATR